VKITNKQRRFYWDVVVPAYMRILNTQNKNMAHDWIKQNFGIKSLSDKEGISTIEFGEKLIELQEFAARVCDIYIRDPNE